MQMNTICLYCSYFHGSSLPPYIRVYLQELKRHYKQIWLLTNEKTLEEECLSWLSLNGIVVRYYKNEGYDFGMWSKALHELNMNDWDEIALVNDSCVAFRRLDRAIDTIRNADWEYAGLIASHQVQWHIQSYFVVMRPPVFKAVLAYFDRQGYKSEFEDVILDYEVGISSYLREMKFKLGAVFNFPDNRRLNPSFMEIAALIRQGFPLIKRKLLTGSYRWEEIRGLMIRNFIFNPEYYAQLIKSNEPQPLIDVDTLKSTSFKLQVLSTISTLLAFPFAFLRSVKSLIGR
jgi:lipopolysaccharide biosynthesis protein